MVTAEDNDELRINNERKKGTLKAAKSRLAEKYEDIRRLSPMVEHGQSDSGLIHLAMSSVQ